MMEQDVDYRRMRPELLWTALRLHRGFIGQHIAIVKADSIAREERVTDVYGLTDELVGVVVSDGFCMVLNRSHLPSVSRGSLGEWQGPVLTFRTGRETAQRLKEVAKVALPILNGKVRSAKPLIKPPIIAYEDRPDVGREEEPATPRRPFRIRSKA